MSWHTYISRRPHGPFILTPIREFVGSSQCNTYAFSCLFLLIAESQLAAVYRSKSDNLSNQDKAWPVFPKAQNLALDDWPGWCFLKHIA